MPAPTGTVTIVFTDIQGSTELWEKLGNSFQASLAIHNRLMREQIAAHGGHEVKTEGDAFMAAFGDAASAVAFAMSVQQALHGAEWPADLVAQPAAETSPDGAFRGLRVRIGMHTGEPIVEPLGDDAVDYFGPAVNRAARMSAAAHGGQVLLSASTFAAAGQAAGCEYLDLGEHRLKGLDQPEHIRQVLPAALAARKFPPIATITKALTNLPAQLTSFIGREDRIGQLAELLRRPDARLVTLLAPGGTGKTRLSIRVGEELLPEFEGGVWFADLTEARDAAAVAQSVAHALGVPLTTKEDPVVIVGRLLQMRKPLLLILDNFEQVVAAAGETVGRWLREAPGLTCLATSRFLLGVAGEREYELPPLSTPPRVDGERHETAKIVARLSAYDSVQLFVDRALQVQPAFALTRETADDVARICTSLEGLPLAIELAAARVRVMKPAKILQNLDKRFSLLKSSRRDLTDRQRTLEGAIQWSYELLDENERAVLHQCAVFRGGFMLEAAEAVLEAGDDLAMDVVQALRDKSFLKSYEQADEVRFGMLESVREFLLQRQSLDAQAVQRHADYFLGDAAERRAALESPTAVASVNWLEAESLNIESGLLHMSPPIDAVLAFNEMLRLRGPFARRVPLLQAALADNKQPSALHTALSRALQDLGRLDEAERSAEEALQSAESDAERVQAICRLATILYIRGRYDDAVSRLDEAFALAKDDRLRALVMGTRGPVLRRLGRSAAAEQDFLNARRIEQQRGNAAGVAANELNLGNVYRASGRPEDALQSYRQAEAAQLELGNKGMIALAAGNIGILCLERQEYDEAAGHFQRAEALEREIGNPSGIAFNLGNRGIALQQQEKAEEALACFIEAESLLRAGGDAVAAATHAMNAAALLTETGRYEEATMYAERAREDFEALKMHNSPGWVLAMEICATVASKLGRKEQSRMIARQVLEGAKGQTLGSSNTDVRVTRAIRKMREMDS